MQEKVLIFTQFHEMTGALNRFLSSIFGQDVLTTTRKILKSGDGGHYLSETTAFSSISANFDGLFLPGFGNHVQTCCCGNLRSRRETGFRWWDQDNKRAKDSAETRNQASRADQRKETINLKLGSELLSSPHPDSPHHESFLCQRSYYQDQKLRFFPIKF